MASKKNIMAMVTIFTGAALNVLLNYLLIPDWGCQGAAFATAVSYIVIFLIRAVDTRRFVVLDLDLKKLILNSALLTVQAVLLLQEVPYLFWFELLVLVLMFLVNLAGILTVLDRFYRAFLSKRSLQTRKQ